MFSLHPGHTPDCSAAERAVHTLKGGAGNLGFTAVFDAAKELDELLRHSIGDTPRVHTLIAQLETAQQALQKALDGTTKGA
ncbi:Hpt domain-containing protein [Zoogloea sp.]|uniref:Hpt domain-containing protein n=1 Tax=Zoogloea sp. TaxID=49181 RepID=UPI0035B26E71